MQQIALPPGGLPGVRPFSSLLEEPPRGEGKGGDPRGLSFKSGAREGGGEPKLQVGGRLLARGVEPIKRGKGREGNLSGMRDREGGGQSYNKRSETGG